MTKGSRTLVDRAMCSVTRLVVYYCEFMTARIIGGNILSSEMSFEMSNTISAISKILAVLCKMADKSERADADDQRPLP